MPFEKRSASQVVTFAPATPSYTQTVITAGTGLTGVGVSVPFVVIPPLLSSPGSYAPQTGDVFRLRTSGNVLKEATLFTAITVTPNTANNAWNVYFEPVPAVSPVAGDKVVSLQRPAHARWLGSIGHVTGLKYSYTCPGGPNSMSCTLQAPPDYRTEALNPGRVVQIFRGGGCVWDGVLDEPVPSSVGWAVTAHGAGTTGTDFAAIYGTWGADDPVDEAIARGLRWINPGIGTPTGIYLSQQQDSGSESVTDHLNLITTGGALLWDVQEGQGSSLPSGSWVLRVFAYPTDAAGNPNGDATRILVATVPVARTIAADINTLVMRYQVTPDIPATSVTAAIPATFATISVQNTASARQHGVMEYYVDLTSSGTFSAAQAQQIGNNILSRYVRANWAGPFTVGPGQYLNAGGVPVDLGCEHAAEVVQLIVTDGGYGGEVGPAPLTFLVGTYEYDNDSDTATITPFAGVRTDISSLISSLYPSKFGGP